MTDLTDTIVAIASPAGIGAVALLRISGPEAWTVARRAFPAKSPFTSRRAHYGNVTDAAGCIIDNVLLTPFTGPASYTGEHVVEIGCHGGILVTRQVLARLMECGARAAEPGEFTQRAWLNGKMDLTQAEAVMDVISAQTDLALRAAQRQLEGRLGSAITALRDDLLELLAHVEACIDFPEEDISPETGNHLIARTMDLETRIAVLLATASHGRILREGVRTVIAGPPNVGKSSLLNLLLGCERAIVSATPGTTRDTIEEVINLRGLPLRLIDTAGLRESTDAIEQEGVARSRHQIDTADLVLEVVDASAPRTERIMLPADNPAKHILILHKSDLPLHPSWSDTLGITVSSLQKTGLDALSDHISATLTETAGGIGNTETAVSARHESLLQRASSSLSAARARMATATAPEFTALDLHEALEALGEVVGRTNSEDLLAVIFSRFCIGK